jgi:hypothetical protein
MDYSYRSMACVVASCYLCRLLLDYYILQYSIDVCVYGVYDIMIYNGMYCFVQLITMFARCASCQSRPIPFQ